MFTDEELAIEERAIQFAKKNRTKICREITNKEVYRPEQFPVSVFMSGSPGAGKTEISKAMIAQLEKNKTKILRLDPDDLRERFPEYSGGNSYLFQRAVSLLVERALDYIHKNNQSVLLDGTLASYPVARKNIKRSLDKDRLVLILFVHQRADLAWKFVEARERVEGRRIQPEHFVTQYFGAQEVIEKLKLEFGKNIKIDVLLKDNDGKTKNHYSNVDSVIPYLKPRMHRDDVENMIGLR
ncbi:zeta toxin family protein [Aliivibrio sp. S10_S31]|uniref:zeta toxin family protein n=1 Tax=Aliivibrio sp. S10_S31 TaxID=2720224 RepID=UPI0016804D9C|nr:zeta toxin family protein [Aliivibrio sp. S10_S31]MBD1567976.1 AAA family ATPase [Aliivibrio sp. S10_S31]